MKADPTKACNEDNAPGFIRLKALRLKVTAKVQRKIRHSSRPEDYDNPLNATFDVQAPLHALNQPVFRAANKQREI